VQKKLRVLLFSNENSQFSKLHLLKLLVQAQVELIGIITNHNHSIRSERIKFVSVYNFFKRLHDRIKFELNVFPLKLQTLFSNYKSIRIMHPNKLTDRLASEIVLMNPDLIISAGYSQKIPNFILKIPNIGSFNFHPSLLPAYAGGNPWFWVIAKGEKYTGVSIHLMTSVFDAGDIVLQKRIKIAIGATEQYLFNLTTIASISLIPIFINMCIKGAIPMNAQNLSKRSYYSKVTDLDRKINWYESAESIKNLIQACLSGFGAWTEIGDKRIWINKVNIGKEINEKINRGTVIKIDKKGIAVATNDKVLIIIVGIVDGKRMTHLALVKKIRINEGDIFN